MDHGTTPVTPPTPHVVQMEDNPPATVPVAETWQCPPWCDEGPGHGFDASSSSSQDATRSHERLIWTCETGSLESSSAWIHQEETVVGGGSRGVWRGPLRLLIDIETLRLSSAATRSLADALRTAADYIDTVNSETPR